MGEIQGDACIEVSGDTAWWVERTYRKPHGHVEDGVFVTPYADLSHLAAWILRLDGRAVPLEPDELRRTVATGPRRVVERHIGPPPTPAKAKPRPAEDVVERPSGPVNPERSACCRRSWPTSSRPAATRRARPVPARDLVERFPQIPEDALEETSRC